MLQCLTMEGQGIGRGQQPEKKRKRSEAAWRRSWEAKQRKRQKRPRTYARSWWDKSHTCRPRSQSWAYNGRGWSKGVAKCWENNCVLNHSDFSDFFRLHCNSYSTACTVFPKEIVLCSHFYFCFFVFFFVLCSAVFFFSVSQWHGLSTNYSTNSKSVNVNLVQSLAINLPRTLRCNLQFTIIVIKTLAIVYIRTSLQSTLLYWQHD